jgi:hypothetical protein
METNLSLLNVEEHSFFSKTWNSYSEFKRDLEQYQKDENVILSTFNSKTIKNNDQLKQIFAFINKKKMINKIYFNLPV